MTGSGRRGEVVVTGEEGVGKLIDASGRKAGKQKKEHHPECELTCIFQ